jgi:aspartate racemase
MKTIGMIGGMSWESTVTYYQIVNETVKETLGGLHSAKLLLYSVDFFELEACLQTGDWAQIADILTAAAKNLEAAGADFILICTNTMHKVARRIATQIGIPILHIAEAAAEELGRNGIKKAALLGTKYTMQLDFYKEKLAAAGIEVLLPEEADMDVINRVIFEELCLGIVSEEAKMEYIRVIDILAKQGAEGVLFACTEIGMLIGQEDSSLPVFDTTPIHARKAALLAVGE